MLVGGSTNLPKIICSEESIYLFIFPLLLNAEVDISLLYVVTYICSWYIVLSNFNTNTTKPVNYICTALQSKQRVAASKQAFRGIGEPSVQIMSFVSTSSLALLLIIIGIKS